MCICSDLLFFVESPGYTQRLFQFFTGDKCPSFNLKGELKKLIFSTSREHVVVSEDAGTFTMVMSTLTQYEKQCVSTTEHYC